MTKIIYLSPGEQMPDRGDDEPWLIVEASDDGRFFGTGAAWNPSGEWVGYGSLPKNDGAFADAVAAAERWAAEYKFLQYGFKLLHRSAFAQNQPLKPLRGLPDNSRSDRLIT
ncbi:hypothetical protein [Sphingomonas sp. PP-CE-1G-424]|uniref:hypothetical protein n=1 Tax=Sphingomonas sp. PP-CE-1G-424 TaxID=2135658 RepID=UPI001055F5FB|nr:hypothetical protein [Sphingomonas sp. PP-CE-1G-424]TCP67939.1 hypothetical protein C8J43_103583 [Sphingomonas sp. PP-CE-1G-424]